MALNSLTSFRRNIKPTLRCISAEKRAHVVIELHRLAEEKIGLESDQDFAPQSVSDNREAGNQLKCAGVRLAHAKTEVETAKACLDEDMQKFHAEDFGWEELLKKVDLALESAANYRKFYTAAIHPDLRTPAEKRLINPNDEIRSYGSPASGVAASDYWFIERAERLLKKCRSPKGKKLSPSDYQNIISKTFAAALNQPGYNKGRIKTALRRISERPRPNYAAPWAVRPRTKPLQPGSKQVFHSACLRDDKRERMREKRQQERLRFDSWLKGKRCPHCGRRIATSERSLRRSGTMA